MTVGMVKKFEFNNVMWDTLSVPLLNTPLLQQKIQLMFNFYQSGLVQSMTALFL